MTEAVSLEEQKAYADAHGDGRPRTEAADPIAELEDHGRRVIEGANLSAHARMMALPKLAELVFWIRSGSGRG